LRLAADFDPDARRMTAFVIPIIVVVMFANDHLRILAVDAAGNA
jgi:hypothetical protein